MTMLTRCAACDTAFRITTEQLVLRQGRVRCGKCGEVFSALEHIVRNPDDMAPHAAAQTDMAPVVTIAATHPGVASLSAPELTTAEVVLNGAAIVANRQGHEVDSLRGHPLATPAEAEIEDGSTLTAVEEVSMDASATPEQVVAVTVPRTADRTWLSAIGVVLAGITLAVQPVYFYRNEVAAHFPEVKPWLIQMCAQLSCKFDSPRDAQAISIESHDLQADPLSKNLLALIALLRNRAPYAQDAPHLELTLTDAQDAPLARRVLAPREYFAAPQMAAGSELPVRVTIDASQIKAAGYRLYAFYP